MTLIYEVHITSKTLSVICLISSGASQKESNTNKLKRIEKQKGRGQHKLVEIKIAE
jgi:hypothetical protein